MGGIALVVASSVACACIPPPPPAAPPPCPYEGDVVQVNGDSVARAMADHLRPPGRAVSNAAQSRSGFTFAIPADNPNPGRSPVPSIVSAVTDRIERCGAPDLLVVSGGINDLSTRGIPASTMRAAVVELADWLRDRNIPTIWVTVVPYPARSSYLWSYPQRQVFNQWLLAGGPGWGRTVDCVPALQDPGRLDLLNPRFEVVVDLFGGVDGVHPNDAGYQAFAACVQAGIG